MDWYERMEYVKDRIKEVTQELREAPNCPILHDDLRRLQEWQSDLEQEAEFAICGEGY